MQRATEARHVGLLRTLREHVVPGIIHRGEEMRKGLKGFAGNIACEDHYEPDKQQIRLSLIGTRRTLVSG